jgi:hypothetical protein
MRRTLFGSRFASLLVLAAGAALVAAPARAEDPAPAGGVPKPLPKAEHAFLDSLVGSWDASVKAAGGEYRGTDRWTKVAGDTAWVHEMSLASEKDAFHGLGVLRLAADGKSLSMWWYDSHGRGGVWKFRGTAGPEGFEVASDEGGMRATKGFSKAEGGLAYRMTVNGKEVGVGTWKKAAKDAAPAPIDPEKCPLAKHPFVRAQLGDWKITATSMGTEYEGASRYRLAVGGHHVLHDYALAGGPEDHRGFGVSALSADGTTITAWWFSNYFPEPLALTGPVTDVSWKGTGKGFTGEFTIVVTAKDGAMESVMTQGGAEIMKETYRRPAPAK